MRFNIGGDRSKLDSAAKCHQKCIMTDYSNEDVGNIVLLNLSTCRFPINP